MRKQSQEGLQVRGAGGSVHGAGNSWAAASPEKLLMKQFQDDVQAMGTSPLSTIGGVGEGETEREEERGHTPPWLSHLFSPCRDSVLGGREGAGSSVAFSDP